MINLNFKTKVITLLIAIGMIPMLSVAIYSLMVATDFAQTTTKNKLVDDITSKKMLIDEYFSSMTEQVIKFSNEESTLRAFKEFKSSTNSLLLQSNSRTDESLLKKRYNYQKTNTPNANSNSVNKWLNIDSTAKQLQHLYISSNPNEIGSKEHLTDANDGSDYSKAHAKYHPNINKLLQKSGYYDIFLFDGESGRLMYSVFKETDYGTSLYNGPYADSNLGSLVKRAMKATKPNEIFIEDFSKYEPSYNAPAAFLASPIFENGKVVGLAVFQMPIARINSLMENKSQLYKNNESYLLGHDLKMRSNSTLLEEDTLGKKINTSLLSSILKKDNSIESGIGYKGNNVILTSRSLKLPDLNWYIVSEVDEDEVMRTVENMQLLIIVAIISCLIILIFVSMYSFKVIIAPVRSLQDDINIVFEQSVSTIEQMEKSSNDMVQAAKQTNQESKLIKDSTSQASDNTTSVAAAIEEMDATIVQINENSNQTSLDVATAVEKAMQTGEIVDELGKASTKISDVVNIIHDLTGQINLLALNASIEAARAGENGRGFSVVAEEVKSLASDTANAAQDIANQIKHIQTVSTKSVDSIQEIRTSIQTIDTTMKTVSNAVLEQTSATGEISERINDTVGRMESLDQNMHTIENVSSSALIAASEVNEASTRALEELNKQKEGIERTLKSLGL